MMNRYQAIQLIMEQIEDEPVVCNIGHPSQELFGIKDRPKNFYMLGSMGLASSIGLGLAMSQPGKVVVIEGDGSVLMNLGSIATIGTLKPSNLCLIVIDNSSYGSTGFQPTLTAKGFDLAEVIRSCGVADTNKCRTRAGLRELLSRSLNRDTGPECLVIKTSRDRPRDISIVPLRGEEIRDRFMEGINAGKSLFYERHPD